MFKFLKNMFRDPEGKVMVIIVSAGTVITFGYLIIITLLGGWYYEYDLFGRFWKASHALWNCYNW